jgi:hypothetical protein
MAEGETPQEFRERMRSIGFMAGGRTRDKVRTVMRPDDGGVDSGQKAKQTKDELGNVVTESSNRQDVAVRPQTIQVKLGGVVNGAK